MRTYIESGHALTAYTYMYAVYVSFNITKQLRCMDAHMCMFVVLRTGVYLGSYAAALQQSHLHTRHISLVISLSPFFAPIHRRDIDYWIVEADDRPWIQVRTSTPRDDMWCDGYMCMAAMDGWMDGCVAYPCVCLQIGTHFDHLTEAMHQRITHGIDHHKQQSQSDTSDEKQALTPQDDGKQADVADAQPNDDTKHGSPTTPASAVLVHCMQGRSRSASVVAAYLMRYHGHTPTSAVTYMQQRRSIVQPNAGFMEQIEAYHVLLQARARGEEKNATTNHKDDMTHVMSRYFAATSRSAAHRDSVSSISSSTSTPSTTAAATATSVSPLYDTSGSPGTWSFKRRAQHHMYSAYYKWLYGTAVGNVMHRMVDRVKKGGREERTEQWRQRNGEEGGACGVRRDVHVLAVAVVSQ